MHHSDKQRHQRLEQELIFRYRQLAKQVTMTLSQILYRVFHFVPAVRLSAVGRRSFPVAGAYGTIYLRTLPPYRVYAYI